MHNECDLPPLFVPVKAWVTVPMRCCSFGPRYQCQVQNQLLHHPYYLHLYPNVYTRIFDSLKAVGHVELEKVKKNLYMAEHRAFE